MTGMNVSIDNEKIKYARAVWIKQVLLFKNFKLVDVSFLGQFNTVTHQVRKQFQWSVAKLLQMGKSCTTLNEWIRQIGIDLLKSSGSDKDIFLTTLGDTLSKYIVIF